MNVLPGQTKHFVTMRLRKPIMGSENISYNPMAFVAGVSKVDEIKVQSMICENIRTIGQKHSNQLLVSGYFSAQDSEMWKCFPASAASYFDLFPLMVFPVPMVKGITDFGGRDLIAVELTFLLGYLDRQYEYLRQAGEVNNEAWDAVQDLVTGIESAAFKTLAKSEYETFKEFLEEMRITQSFIPLVSKANEGSQIQLDLW